MKAGNFLKIEADDFAKLKDKAPDNSIDIHDRYGFLNAVASISKVDTLSKIHSIKFNVGALALDADDPTYTLTKAFLDKIVAGKIWLNGVTNNKNDMELIKHDTVEKFFIKEGYDLTVSVADFNLIKDKMSKKDKVNIQDTSENISKNLDVIQKYLTKIKTLDSSDNKKINIEKEKYEAIKDIVSQDDKDNNVYDVKGPTPDEMPTPDPSESPKPVYGETENAIYEYKGITQIKNTDGSTTYNIGKADDLEGGTHVIHTKPGDVIDFAKDITSIERLANKLEHKDGGLPANSIKYFMRGDDLYVYISRNDANKLKGDVYDANIDTLLVFKNVNLGKVKIGESAQGTTDGRFKLYGNTKKEGLVKVSDEKGFIKFFGDEAPGVKIPGIDNIYKDADGKYFIDAAGTQPLDTDSMAVRWIDFGDKGVFAIGVKGYAGLMSLLNMDQIKKLSFESVASSLHDGDTLKLGDTTYTFLRADQIKEIKIGNDKTNPHNNFIYKSMNPNAMTTQLVKDKAVTVEKFFDGDFNANYMLENDTVTYKNVKYTFGADQKITKIEGYGKKDGFDTIEDIGVSAKTLKELKQAFMDKVADNSITKLKDDGNVNFETLKSLESIASKFKAGAINKVELGIDELAKLSSTLVSKISDAGITLKGGVLDTDTLEAVKANGGFDKLKAGSIKDIDMTAEAAKALLSTPGAHTKFANKSINIKGSNSQEIQKLLDYLDTDTTRYLANKIKSIDSTTNDDRISVSRDMFNKLGEDAFATDDTIRATDLQPKDKAIALSDKVDVFTMADFYGMQSLLEVTVQEFKKILQEQKSSSATFTIKDTSANIQNGIMDLIANKDRLGDNGQGIDSTENNVPIDLSNLTKEQYDSIKGKISAYDKVIPPASSAYDDAIPYSEYEENKSMYASGQDIKIKDLPSNGSTQATDANETFIFDKTVKNFQISDFGTNDKINLKNIGATDSNLVKISSAQSAQNGKIYKADIASDIENKNFSGSDFAELAQYLNAIEANGKAVFAAKGKDQTQIYSISDDGNGIIEKDEIKLVATITNDKYQGVDLTENNMDFS